MSPLARASAAMVLAAFVSTALAEEAGPAIRPELFVSSDSDRNISQRQSLGWDVHRRDIEHWWGFRAERARFGGEGWRETAERIFVRGAGGDGAWRWQAEAGTDGEALLGSASLFSTGARRREFFLERDVLETREGLRLGKVNTYAGAALDWPLSERWSATGLAGLQDFGGANLRRHMRANLIYALAPEQGLSLQLRWRQFNDSEPRELDYFAPGRYRQTLGVLQVRRFTGGYQWRLAAGWGRQSFTGGGDQASRLLELDFQTPKDRGHFLRASAGYSDAPAAAADGGQGYDYRYVRIEAVWVF